MPRVTISTIAGTQARNDGEILNFDLPSGMTVGALKEMIQSETGVQAAAQHLYFNNRPMRDNNQTLESNGIKDGDMIAMVLRNNQTQAQQSSQGFMDRRAPSAEAQHIESTRQRLINNPQAMAQLQEQQPALSSVIHDPERFQAIWQEMVNHDRQREGERLDEIDLLNEDFMNVDNQRKIEEMIRQQQVMENLQFAYTHSPEVFARVTMLYIPVTVNNYPVKAFVDSGAQTTIMSPSCAETCGIMRLIDRRYSGIAKGVGTAQILGRVHAADITIGTSSMSCSFTVMEGKDVDLLLGLDMLKRFQALIDLRRNVLVFGDNNEVSFLPESEIPRRFEDAEPTVAGPGGTEIGATTGTVKPAGSSQAAAAASAAAASTQNHSGPSTGKTSSGLSPASITTSRPSNPATAPPVPEPSSAASQNSSKYPSEAIAQLTALGFTEAQAIQALDACDGNVEYAAGLLFGS